MQRKQEYFDLEGIHPVSEDTLRNADPDNQIEVMKEWFFHNFEDPAQHTPYESPEGYIYIYGGPYDARTELESEFSDIVPDEVIDKLVDELQEECFEWSGKPDSEDYDRYYYQVIQSNTNAHLTLADAQVETRRLLDVTPEGEELELLLRLLYVNAITVLETFLSDFFVGAISADQSLMKKFVATNPDFKERKFSLNELFDCLDRIEKEVRTYLVDLIWHNLAKVKKMYKAVMDIDFPVSAKPLYKAIAKRHDLVHRNGRDKEGNSVSVSRADVENLLQLVRELADHIDSQFEENTAEEAP
jgi:hypothetical protein